MKKIPHFLLVLAISISGCKQSVNFHRKPVTIRIQPFIGVPENYIHYVSDELKKIYPTVIISNKIPLPEHTLNKLGYRYRAELLLKFLNSMAMPNETVIGLTARDISTTKGDKDDWGVMGLGNCPGNVCVASSFRLVQQRKTEQYYKVAVHELGHTFGLPHCPVKTCYMRDAEGGNTTDEEKEFCTKCKTYLKKRSWNL